MRRALLLSASPGKQSRPHTPEQRTQYAYRASLRHFVSTQREQLEVVERDEQRGCAHLAESKLGLEEAALLDGPGEASGCCPLGWSSAEGRANWRESWRRASPWTPLDTTQPSS